jgi:hypothetical protein
MPFALARAGSFLFLDHFIACVCLLIFVSPDLKKKRLTERLTHNKLLILLEKIEERIGSSARAPIPLRAQIWLICAPKHNYRI